MSVNSFTCARDRLNWQAVTAGFTCVKIYWGQPMLSEPKPFNPIFHEVGPEASRVQNSNFIWFHSCMNRLDLSQVKAI